MDSSTIMSKQEQQTFVVINGLRFLYSFTFFIFIALYFTLNDFNAYKIHKYVNFKSEIHTLYVALIFIFLIDSLVQFKKINKNLLSTVFVRPPINKIISYTMFILLILVILINNAKTLSVWSDELFQYSLSFMSPISQAISQHQPPLSYIQTAMSSLMTSDVLWAIKLFSVINSLFFITLICLLLKNLCNNYIPAIVFTLLVFLTYPLLYYTVEARPQTLAFVYLIFFLYEIYHLHFYKKTLNMLDLLGFYLVCLIFLLTVGLQPIFMIFTGTVVYLLMTRNKKAWQILSVGFISIATYLPCQFLIKKASVARLNEKTFLNLISGLFSKVYRLNFERSHLLNINFYFYFLLIVVSLSFLYFIRKKKLNKNLKISFFLIAVMFFFIHSFTQTYSSFVNYHLAFRYYILAFPILFVVLSLLFVEFYKASKQNNLMTKIMITVFVTSLVLPVETKNMQDIKEVRGLYYYNSLETFKKVKTLVNQNTHVYCLAARWKAQYRYCSGFIHFSSRHNALKENLYKEISYAPNYKMDWGHEVSKINAKKFIFVFYSNRDELINIKLKLNSSESYITDEAVIVVVNKAQQNKDEVKKLLVKFNQFISSSQNFKQDGTLKEYLDANNVIQ